MARGIEPSQFAVVSLIVVALVACWCSDMVCGLVPDIFTLGPLAVLLLVALWQHNWWLVISAAISFVPFAGAAALSHGLGMGWGDVKLATLGGAFLGARTAMFALAAACIVAVVVNRIAGMRRGPIALAPYLAAAIGLAIPVGALL
ncbi:MAG: prepilin peptidase [Candidatus Eremiobacteraeota bacterium]|nr:prepilin peptidase [Candidatus Eremiobacteraeota bacterium]